jgi:hypothetical protein
LGPPAQLSLDLSGQLARVAPQPLHDLRRDAVGLLQESQQQVLRLDLGMVESLSLRLRLQESFLGFLGVFIRSHSLILCFFASSYQNNVRIPPAKC